MHRRSWTRVQRQGMVSVKSVITQPMWTNWSKPSSSARLWSHPVLTTTWMTRTRERSSKPKAWSSKSVMKPSSWSKRIYPRASAGSSTRVPVSKMATWPMKQSKARLTWSRQAKALQPAPRWRLWPRESRWSVCQQCAIILSLVRLQALVSSVSIMLARGSSHSLI